MIKNTSLTLLLFAFVLATCAGASDLPPMTPDWEWRGRIVVEFTEDLGAIQVDKSTELALLGEPSLDALARQFNVYQMEKLIPWFQKPEDPSVPDLSRYYILSFPLQIDVHAVADAYLLNRHIISADPYQIHKTDYTPNDPFFSSQWALTITQAATAYNYCQGSSSVIVGIVDSGTDTTHPDLRNNLWINPAEDLNHNGMIEPSEWNGIDNGANGYVDDFWGWNVWQSNNNVQDPPVSQGGGHGTHCAGDATAVTDNALGIGSLGYKAKIMTARAGDGSTIYAGTLGISYCAANGADIISLSWGGSFYNPYEQSVINYAWSQGCAIFASAGNSNSSAAHYPAAYDNVIAVAATNQSDQKSSYSNYGTWVDICAPGDGILSSLPGGSYGAWDGTSFSTPITSGLAALIWAAKPTWSNSQVINQILTTATNIYPQNPGYIGMLGSGRINAGAAISSLYPQLSYTEQVFDDNGNNDGRPDPGEICDFLLTVANASTTVAATGVNITLTCTDPAIIINQAACSLGNVPAGGSANNHADPINFSVASTAQPHEVTFTLTLTATNLTMPIVTPIVQMVGRPGILVVDDDGGATYQTWYDQTLDSLNRAHDMWTVSTQGAIPTATLQLYPNVIWHTSNLDNPLTTAEQTTITTYLNGGGHIFLTGEDIDEQLGSSAFYSTTLHSTSLSAAGYFQLNGVPGDSISNGTSLWLIGAGGAGNSQSPSAIGPAAGASTVYTYTTTSQGAATKWTSGNNKIVYFAFNFEAISGIGGTTSRTTLMNNILNWFGASSPPPVPPVEIFLTPINPPIQIPAQGGTFSYDVGVHNTTTSVQNCQGWIMQLIPGGTWQGPMLGPISLALPVGANISRQRNQNVPSSAAPGTYTYIAYSGTYSTVKWDSAYFTYTKLADLDGGPWVGDWNNYGESFDLISSPDAVAPAAFALLGAAPNPFNPTTTLHFMMPYAANVSLNVFDLSGRSVAQLVNGWREVGNHSVEFDGSALVSGVYLIRMQAGSFAATDKMLLVK